MTNSFFVGRYEMLTFLVSRMCLVISFTALTSPMLFAISFVALAFGVWGLSNYFFEQKIIPGIFQAYVRPDGSFSSAPLFICICTLSPVGYNTKCLHRTGLRENGTSSKGAISFSTNNPTTQELNALQYSLKVLKLHPKKPSPPLFWIRYCT